jgi:hypothetical protein
VARWSSAALALAFWCAGAAADWTAVGPGDYIASAYADKATIHKSGSMATMSGLYDFRRQDFTPEGKALYSTVVLREYDCGARRVRLLSSIDFAGHMGAGEAVDSSARPGRWEDVVAGALDEAFWTIACGP